MAGGVNLKNITIILLGHFHVHVSKPLCFCSGMCANIKKNVRTCQKCVNFKKKCVFAESKAAFVFDIYKNKRRFFRPILSQRYPLHRCPLCFRQQKDSAWFITERKDNKKSMEVTEAFLGNCYVNVIFYLAITNHLRGYSSICWSFFGWKSEDICTKRRDLHGEGQGYAKRCMLIYVTQLSRFFALSLVCSGNAGLWQFVGSLGCWRFPEWELIFEAIRSVKCFLVVASSCQLHSLKLT